MPVTQSLPIILRGVSVFQGPTQMTRVDRLASWWWWWWYTDTRETDPPRNMADVSVSVAGFGILRISADMALHKVE